LCHGHVFGEIIEAASAELPELLARESIALPSVMLDSRTGISPSQPAQILVLSDVETPGPAIPSYHEAEK
jgi:hypothetical protein